jgi:hypothetical protein
MSNKITLKASKFIEWYFADDLDYKIVGERMSFLLKTNGSAYLDVEYLFNEQDELPDWICENVPEEFDGEEYIPTDEIEFINDFEN